METRQVQSTAKVNADDRTQTYQYVIIHQSIPVPANWHNFWQIPMGFRWYCDNNADFVPT